MVGRGDSETGMDKPARRQTPWTRGLKALAGSAARAMADHFILILTRNN